MKNLMYRLFALFFNLSRILPVHKNRISFLAPHPGGEHDSLGVFASYLRNKGDYDIRKIDVPRSGIASYIGFFLNKSRILATSGYIFLNDNFMPLADLKISPKTKVVQFWHGEGAFKKFNLMTELEPEIREREIRCSEKLDYITCSSEKITGIYAESFGVERDKILPAGSPRLDYLIDCNDKEKLREEFDTRHPECRGKKLVLYAPTFRETPEKDRELLEGTDAGYFNEKAGDEYSLIIKLHPRIHSACVPGNATDVTGEDISSLTLISDILVTDYSSVCMDFAYLGKPCVFYAFDLEEYEKERDFCFGYEDYVPGPVIKDFRELPDTIKNPFSPASMQSFREFNFDYTDNKNCERIYERIFRASS